MDPYRSIGRFRRTQAMRDGHFQAAYDKLEAAFAAPLSAQVPAYYGNGKTVPVSHEMVAWVIDQAVDAHATLAEAMFNESARERLIDAFICAQAERDAQQTMDADEQREAYEAMEYGGAR